MFQDFGAGEDLQGHLAQQRQAPTLSWTEERKLRAGLAWRHSLEWLMAPQADVLPTTLEELLHRPEWQRDAACSGAGADGFIPGAGGSFKAARELCRSCLVQGECLRFALADEELVGMWGGTTERERREMRRRRQRGAA